MTTNGRIDQRTDAHSIEEVATGKLTATQCLSQFEAMTAVPWRERDFSDAFNLMQHVSADVDIAGRDSSYARSQAESLIIFAERLRKPARDR